MPATQQISRYGLYYFNDTTHYRESDIHRWIPELQTLKASWITLLSPIDRAIPEIFIRSLIQAGIQPIIHLPLPCSNGNSDQGLDIIFEAYAHWGVKYITLYDRPNLRQNWAKSSWAQPDLIDRFLDIFLPVAHLALQAGLAPSFPALEPGGDYWDTAFLYTALQGILRRGDVDILDQLLLSAYAWCGNRSPNWGAGGPDRWPSTRPYSTPQNSEDQLGFRIFDWYLAVSQAALGKHLPIILLAGGSKIGDQPDFNSPAVDQKTHTWQNMTLIRLLSGEPLDFDPIPAEVLTCNFWLLSAEQNDPELNNAWYKPDWTQLPIVAELKRWASNVTSENTSPTKTRISHNIHDAHPIAHYLLLHEGVNGVTDSQLNSIRPFINKFQPTIGFSLAEASHAKKVTIISGEGQIPEAIIDGLFASGCIVEQIDGDGMNIAPYKIPYSQMNVDGDRSSGNENPQNKYKKVTK